VSDACEDGYRTMIKCAASSGWETLRGRNVDYPCREETEAFLAVCPALWFDKEDAP